MSSPQRPTPRRVPFPIFDEPSAISTLPANHFLARRPVTPPPPPSVIAERYWSARARPDTSSLAAADYDVSVQTGFLPPEEPVRRLEVGAGWDAIEECLEVAQREVQGLQGGGVGRVGEAWRESVRRLEKPSVEVLTDLPLLRRAHVALSFLSHFYIHSSFPSLSTVPAALAVPWVEVSDRLGIPPILTYADTVLWNWRLVDPSLGLRADNVAIDTTFTSSPSEDAFFLLSLLSELHAPSLLRLMSATLDESFFADTLALPRIASYLLRVAAIIDELKDLMAAATRGSFGVDGLAKIIPECFYWEIRPWFNGGKWTYEAVDEGEDKEMEWGGPSAGQSSLIHAVDLFLGVDHSPRPSASATTSSTTSMDPTHPLPPHPTRSGKHGKFPEGSTSDSTFMLRAAQYMPSHHRSFLAHLSSLHTPSPASPRPIPSLRTLALAHPSLAPSYDTAVRAMKEFRDGHMRLATVFIVSQARRTPGRESVFWEEWEEKEREKEKVGREGVGRETLMGTGGTELVTFLKTCRDRTKEALVGEKT